MRHVVRNARYIAFAGTAVGAALLLRDLKTPARWYNMLRIFRRTSPMSLGTYILSAFSLLSGAAAFLPGKAARAAQIPAAAAGAGMSTYTAALLSATSTPLWAAQAESLGPRFAASSMATAAAALTLAERLDGGAEETCRDLDAVAAVATAAELGATVIATRGARARGVAAPSEESATGALEKWGAVTIGVGAPLLCFALNATRRRRSPALSLLGSLAVLAGGAMMRHAVLQAGNRSARRPAEYFRFTQPRITAEMTRRARPPRLPPRAERPIHRARPREAVVR
jgi:formate-dependent nitrite reductase membrane component NrfD